MLRLYKFEIDCITAHKIRFIHICSSCCIYCAFLKTAPKTMLHFVPILRKYSSLQIWTWFKTAHKKLCLFIFLEVASKTVLHLVLPFSIRLNLCNKFPSYCLRRIIRWNLNEINNSIVCSKKKLRKNVQRNREKWPERGTKKNCLKCSSKLKGNRKCKLYSNYTHAMRMMMMTGGIGTVMTAMNSPFRSESSVIFRQRHGWPGRHYIFNYHNSH